MPARETLSSPIPRRLAAYRTLYIEIFLATFRICTP